MYILVYTSLHQRHACRATARRSHLLSHVTLFATIYSCDDAQTGEHLTNDVLHSLLDTLLSSMLRFGPMLYYCCQFSVRERGLLPRMSVKVMTYNSSHTTQGIFYREKQSPDTAARVPSTRSKMWDTGRRFCKAERLSVLVLVL